VYAHNNKETTTMKNEIFSLFQEVISAARNGRYMYGNGGQWYIVDGFGNKVMIDTTGAGTKTMVPNYEGTPATDHATADRLERSLDQTEVEWYETTIPYYEAREMVKNAAVKNELLFTNGGQWYINSYGTVINVTLGSIINDNGRQYAAIASANLHTAWKYYRFNNGEATRATICSDTKKFLGIY
jgi:hypothetical protein